jgi:hypothetical protein
VNLVDVVIDWDGDEVVGGGEDSVGSRVIVSDDTSMGDGTPRFSATVDVRLRRRVSECVPLRVSCPWLSSAVSVTDRRCSGDSAMRSQLLLQVAQAV